MPAPATPRSIPPRQLFLLDGLGALLSAVLLGGVLVRFAHVLGLPPQPLYLLAAVALLLAGYSLGCWRLVGSRPRGYLYALAALNLAYCGLTLGVLLYWHRSVTAFGLGYFAGELLIIGGLAALEVRSGTAAGAWREKRG